MPWRQRDGEPVAARSIPTGQGDSLGQDVEVLQHLPGVQSGEGDPWRRRVCHLPPPRRERPSGIFPLQPCPGSASAQTFHQAFPHWINGLSVSPPISPAPHPSTNRRLRNEGGFVGHFCGSFPDPFHFAVVFTSAGSRTGGRAQDRAHTNTTSEWAVPPSCPPAAPCAAAPRAGSSRSEPSRRSPSPSLCSHPRGSTCNGAAGGRNRTSSVQKGPCHLPGPRSR